MLFRYGGEEFVMLLRNTSLDVARLLAERIRRKVEVDPGEPSYIVNVRGFGYMLERRSNRRESARVSEAA